MRLELCLLNNVYIDAETAFMLPKVIDCTSLITNNLNFNVFLA